MARKNNFIWAIFFVVLANTMKIATHEKTLRKIVRNQSKMVHRPFSDDSGADAISNITYHNQQSTLALIFPGHVTPKTVVHKMQRSKMSTILSSLESGKSIMTYSKIKLGKNDNLISNELRLVRNINNIPLRSGVDVLSSENPISESQPKLANENCAKIQLKSFPTASKYFPPVDERELQSVEPRAIGKDTISFPEGVDSARNNETILVKSIYLANPKLNVIMPKKIEQNNDSDRDKADFLLEGVPVASSVLYSYNLTTNPYICTYIKEMEADLDAQELFSGFNIEPHWISKKHFWNNIFDSRYEALMRNLKWPALQVILVPHSHVNSIWKKSFGQYHRDVVHKILSNVVKKLQFYNNLTFTWNEVSHLSEWWKTTTQKNRSAFRKLLKGGRLEITTGGWVETDEATSHLFGLVHQLLEGHQWLKYNLNYEPKVAWLTNSVTHSSTMPYLLSASDLSRLIFTNIHYAWEQYLAEFQISDFIWLQNWDTNKSKSPLNDALNKIGNDCYPKHSLLTHYLQFNSDSFGACGPNKHICTSEFNFAKNIRNVGINSYNIKEKAEKLLEQYSKTGTITPHNVVIAPIGGHFRYELQSEFDYQYNNYQKLADFVNVNSDIYKATIRFGTPSDYFSTVLSKFTTFPTLKGDFLNFADLYSGTPAYWTGFFTSRPQIKILLRRLQSTLRSTEILFSFAVSFNAFRGYNTSNIFELLLKARENVALLQDRHVVSGTFNANTLKYIHSLILSSVKDCWYIQEVSTGLLSTKPGKTMPHIQKYVYRDGEFISPFKTVVPGDQIYIFNSLSHERTEIVELVTRYSNIRVVDHNKKDVTVQINPVWTYNSNNHIKISRNFFKIVFAIAVPPMTLELFKIKDTYDATQCTATLYCLACVVEEVVTNVSIFPFTIQPLQTGDIQLESYKHRLLFDEMTGFLKTVVEKQTSRERTLAFDYGAFKSSDHSSGMFLFNTNISKPLLDILLPYRIGSKSKVILIASGAVTTEFTSVYGRLLQHTVKIFNLLHSPLSGSIYVESKLDYEVSPKNRELEIFLSIQTDISNGNPPQISTDNNGFQFTARLLNISRRVESNMYPFTNMVFIQDPKSRLTLITDHAQGVTALQEGQVIVMLDRRVLFNDGRGANEGLADSSVTIHRHYILLENFLPPAEGPVSRPKQMDINLPSLTALQLSNFLNYHLDVFTVEKNQTHLCYFAFFPLIKTAFPCDVSVITYRIILNSGATLHMTPNTALMVMHRQSFSCRVDHTVIVHCDGDSNFSIDKILRNIKAVYQTNLVGTSKGIPLLNYNYVNFPQMELTTIRIYF